MLRTRAYNVSIHLMLLFIQIHSLVSSYLIVSIHLMLLFICNSLHQILCSAGVSIHLMLLFITDNAPQINSYSCFNTSHVTLYRFLIQQPIPSIFVSIHLMLLFISKNGFTCSSYNLFQYISCYSLSVLLTMDLRFYPCFNTSHVTLYRRWRSSWIFS